ncbi:response regulator [Rubrobacter tropicus]|uniref:Response regulator n=1 Tax=Rubrobacter tropicus TaxID=2653851 RepID=A0A6G8QEY1_9ACTN|nr:response regulator [Rubrobacter tropicus]
MARVLIVDDHAVLREALALFLNQEPDLEVTGQAGSLAEACEMLGDGFDAAVVELTLPDGSATGLVHELRKANPSAAILVLTAETDPVRHGAAVAGGADGVMHKSSRAQEIVEAVRRLLKSQALNSLPETARLLRLSERFRELVRRSGVERLTPREREILQALADGFETRDIAARLGMSERTVHTHVASILRKLGVTSQLQAVVHAVRFGIVRIRPFSIDEG